MAATYYDTCREQVALADRDRFLSVLYAPQDKRGSLLALYAFNAEAAEIVGRSRDPLPGEIRLQWWREVLTGGSYSAETSPGAIALLETIEQHRLPRSAFETYLDARIDDLYADPFQTRNDLEAYCGATASAMLQLSALILDPGAAAQAADAAGHGGCAMGISGLIRLMPLHRARGKCSVPLDLLAAASLTPDTFLAGENKPAIEAAVRMMVALAHDHLKQFQVAAAKLPRTLRAAFLPVALIPAYLDKVKADDPFAASGSLSDLRRQWILMRSATRSL